MTTITAELIERVCWERHNDAVVEACERYRLTRPAGRPLTRSGLRRMLADNSGRFENHPACVLYFVVLDEYIEQAATQPEEGRQR